MGGAKCVAGINNGLGFFGVEARNNIVRAKNVRFLQEIYAFKINACGFDFLAV